MTHKQYFCGIGVQNRKPYIFVIEEKGDEIKMFGLEVPIMKNRDKIKNMEKLELGEFISMLRSTKRALQDLTNIPKKLKKAEKEMQSYMKEREVKENAD